MNTNKSRTRASPPSVPKKNRKIPATKKHNSSRTILVRQSVSPSAICIPSLSIVKRNIRHRFISKTPPLPAPTRALPPPPKSRKKFPKKLPPLIQTSTSDIPLSSPPKRKLSKTPTSAKVHSHFLKYPSSPPLTSKDSNNSLNRHQRGRSEIRNNKLRSSKSKPPPKIPSRTRNTIIPKPKKKKKSKLWNKREWNKDIIIENDCPFNKEYDDEHHKNHRIAKRSRIHQIHRSSAIIISNNGSLSPPNVLKSSPKKKKKLKYKTRDLPNLFTLPNIDGNELPSALHWQQSTSLSIPNSYSNESLATDPGSDSNINLSAHYNKRMSASLSGSILYNDCMDDDFKHNSMDDRINKIKAIENERILSTKLMNLELHESYIAQHERILLEILKSPNKTDVIHAIENAQIDVLCTFLPIIAFALGGNTYKEWRVELAHKLALRIIGQADLRQAMQFFTNSYKNNMRVKAVFAGLLHYETANSKKSVITFSTHLGSKRNSYSTVNTVLGKSGKKKKNKKQKKCKARLPKNCVQFWEKLLTLKLGANDEIVIPSNIVLRDPCQCLTPPMRRISVKKVINSNSKPILIDIYVASADDNYEFRSSTVILKSGDDLRKDAICMVIFKFMNFLFIKHGLMHNGKHVKILTYKVIPIRTEHKKCFGLIELISGCIALKDIGQMEKLHGGESTLTKKHFTNLICSSAASYLAAYIMGIRDRHWDNILIRKTDCTLFHIDFNFVLGDNPSIDASEFGITQELYKMMGPENYQLFCSLMIDAFQILRVNHKQLINFACFAFSYVFDHEKVSDFLFKKLRMNESDDKAKNWLQKELITAPKSKQTKIKNKIHQFVVEMNA